MSENIIISEPLVSVAWLWQHFDADNLIVLDASIPKVTTENSASDNTIKGQIKNARFMDLENEFSDTDARFPNT
ncbi:MAG: sulfurtransferase, partial [Aureibaculum sp.]